jgi:aldose 1-epimerase
LNALKRTLLRHGPITVGLAPEFGALTRFDVQVGENLVEVLRPAIDRPATGPWALGASSFPLIPYGGRLRNGRFCFEGREVTYPLNASAERHSSHGDGWTRPWLLTHLDRCSATMTLSPDPQAPLPYACTQTVSVQSGQVHIVMAVGNLDSRRIPVGVGIHPYFAHRGDAILSAHLPSQWHWDHELMPVEHGPNPDAAAFREGKAVMELPVSAEFDGWDGEAQIRWPARGLSVRLTTAPAMKHAVVWVPTGQDFFCFEPTSHATDGLNLRAGHPPGEDFVVLEPGQVFEQRLTFCV